MTLELKGWVTRGEDCLFSELKESTIATGWDKIEIPVETICG